MSRWHLERAFPAHAQCPGAFQDPATVLKSDEHDIDCSLRPIAGAPRDQWRAFRQAPVRIDRARPSGLREEAATCGANRLPSTAAETRRGAPPHPEEWQLPPCLWAKLATADVERKPAGLVDLRNPDFDDVAMAMGLWDEPSRRWASSRTLFQTWRGEPGCRCSM